MAKIPTVTLYDHNNGAAGSVMDALAVHHTGATTVGLGSTGYYGISFTTATTSALTVWAHHIADTIW
jgi:hypothetical protein